MPKDVLPPAPETVVESEQEKLARMIADAVSAERERSQILLAQKDKELEDLKAKKSKISACAEMNFDERIYFIKALIEEVTTNPSGHTFSSLSEAPQYKNTELHNRSNCSECNFKRDRTEHQVPEQGLKR